MVRLADMGMTVLQEVFTPGFLESEGVACHTRPHGEASGSIRRQRSEGKTWAKLPYGFCGKGKLRQGKQAQAWLV